MKVKLVESILKESVDKEELKNILELISEAHDKIMGAMDELDSLSYEYEDDVIDELKYKLEDVESELSEIDFIWEDDPIEAVYKYFEIEDIDDEEDYKEDRIDMYIQIAEDSVPFETVKEHIDNRDEEFEFEGVKYVIKPVEEDNDDYVISVDFADKHSDFYGTYTLDGKAYTVD